MKRSSKKSLGNPLLNLLKKHLFLISLFAFNQATGQIIGLLGGGDGSEPYAAYVYLNPPSAASITLPSPFGALISSVAINASNQGIAGGADNNNAAYLAAWNSTTSPAIAIAGLPGAMSQINSVAINEFGQGLLGGFDNNNAAYAAYLSLNANSVTPISNLPLSTPGVIDSVAINSCGVGLIGGSDPQTYAAFINPNTNAATPIQNLPNGIEIHSVALNLSSQGLIGGDDNVSIAYLAYVDANTDQAIPINTLDATFINSVAINESGLGLIGGEDVANGAFAAYVDPATHTLIPIANPNLSQGIIQSVAINGSGLGIIGGANELSAAYAAYVDPNTHTAFPAIANLPSGATSLINSVAINEFGQALLSGNDSTGNPYAAYVDPTTQTATLIANLPSMPGSAILSAAMPLSARIPTNSLTGNNLRFAKYINKYARRDVFYFLPAICNDELEDALESAAPTRNALSLFAADRNLFILNHGLSVHLRFHNHLKNRTPTLKSDQMAVLRHSENHIVNLDSPHSIQNAANESSQREKADEVPSSNQRKPIYTPDSHNMSERGQTKEIELTANNLFPLEKLSMDRPWTIWFEGIGALAFQKHQEQTVGCTPWVGGFILAFDKTCTPTCLAGGGIAYTFTQITDHEDQGHSDISQEYLFGYATWADYGFYVDGALWAASFQTHQVRNIHLTGFEFTSTSYPIGLQVCPHLESGYITNNRIVNPLVMLDWVNAWQNRYQEKGNGPFNAEQKGHYSSLLRFEIGCRFFESFSFDSWKLILEEKASYVHTASFQVGRITAFLVGSPGFFTVETLSAQQNLGVAELSFIFEPVDRKYPYGSFSYQGEFGGNYQSHQANLEVSWDF